MSNISQYYLPIIGVLIIIIMLLVAFLLSLRNTRKNDSNDNGSCCPSSYISLEKHKEVLKMYKKTSNPDNSKYDELQDKYYKACEENRALESQLAEFKRSNSELEELLKKSSAGRENAFLTKEAEKQIPPKNETQSIMYASFPRSAGSRSYFSDLSENLVDDSYFELKVSLSSGKATFKPLDFMKIRNYDPAMAAILTEGVKPNLAVSIIGIESGVAHMEGKDWIIDVPAKIKLA